jgi:hypothetical protein
MVKYYLCSGNRTGVHNPEDWVCLDIREGNDVMSINFLPDATFVFATPECNTFTDLPWRRADNSGLPLLFHCFDLCKSSGSPWVLENSRFAQKFLGKASVHYSGHYFWGSGVGCVLPFTHIKGATSGKYPLKRASFPGVILDPSRLWF